MSESIDTDGRVHEGLLMLARIMGRSAARKDLARARQQAEPQVVNGETLPALQSGLPLPE